MEISKKEFQAEIVGIDGGVVRSPVYSSEVEAHYFIDGFMREEAREAAEKILQNRTKYAAVVRKWYDEHGLIFREEKSYYYEW